MASASLIHLNAKERSILGKKVKLLRAEGWTPVHLFGPGIDSQALQVETSHLHKVLTESGRSRPISLSINPDSDQIIVFVKDIQFHPLTSIPIHVDFIKVNISETTKVNIPLLLTGESFAISNLGGTINLEMETILVECPPLGTPNSISVDVSSLQSFEDSIRASDLVVPPDVTILTDREQLIARVSPPAITDDSSTETVAQVAEGTQEQEAVSINTDLTEEPTNPEEASNP